MSLGYPSVLQVGFGLWVAYGLVLGNPILVVPNTMAFCVGGAAIVVSWRYRAAR